MLSALRVVSFGFGILVFIFVVLSLASGLLYLAEMIEENSKASKTFGIRAIYGVILLLCIFYIVDGLPLYLVAIGISSHLIYLSNFNATWPVVKLTSPQFIASCISVIGNHFLNFFYFQNQASEARSRYGNRGRNSYTFSRVGGQTFYDLAAFFGLCVWFVPLYLFLSLSANDHVLPTSSGTPTTPSRITPPNSHARKPSSLLKSALSFLPMKRIPSNSLPQSIRSNTDQSNYNSEQSNYISQRRNPSTPTRLKERDGDWPPGNGFTPGGRPNLSRRSTGDAYS